MVVVLEEWGRVLAASVVALTLPSCVDRVIVPPRYDVENEPEAEATGSSIVRDGSSSGVNPSNETDQSSGVDPDADDASAGASPPSTSSSTSSTSADVPPPCTDTNIELRRTTPDILWMLDQSFSMRLPLLDEQSRWDAVYEALFDPSRGVVYQREAAFRFGMTLFTTSFEGPGSSTPQECPRLRSAEPWFSPATELAALYASQAPLGHTPTGEALERLVDRLEAESSPESPTFIILTTDGEPDTCADGFVDNGQSPALASTQAAFAAGYLLRIVSVGIGDEPLAEHLQDLANAGVGRPTSHPVPAPYHLAHDVEELIAAYEDILRSATRCTFHLEDPVDLERRCEAQVRLDGERRACETDWTLVDPSTLVLLGDTCAQALDRPPREVDVTWPCDAVPAPRP